MPFDRADLRAEALYIANDPLVDANRTHIITLANNVRLPAVFGHRGHVSAGGLICYGPSFLDFWRRSADFIGKILKGGITLLGRADEVIE